MLCNAVALLSALNALEASMSSTASLSCASNTVCIACIAASFPNFWPAHSRSEPLASTTSPLATFITHFPKILHITSSTPTGVTAPLPLSRGINRTAISGSMVAGSIYVVHRVLVIVAIASHSFVDDCLNDFQARILLKPLASTPHGPACTLVLNAAWLTISPFISEYTDSGISSSIGPNRSEPNVVGCGFGCFSFNWAMTSSVSSCTPPVDLSLRNRSAELICPSSTRLARFVPEELAIIIK